MHTQPQPSLTRLLRQWRAEHFDSVRIDTLLTVLGALGARKGQRVSEEWGLCWEVTLALGCKREQTRALCAWARLHSPSSEIALPDLLTRMVKTADMSGTFDLIQVLNVFLRHSTNPAAHLTIPALNHLVSLLLLRTPTKRDQAYLASTLSFLQSLQRSHHHLGLE